MADVTSTIRLEDKMSGVFKNVIKNMRSTEKAMQSLDDAMAKHESSAVASAKRAALELEAENARYINESKLSTQQHNQWQMQEQQRHNNAMRLAEQRHHQWNLQQQQRAAAREKAEVKRKFKNMLNEASRGLDRLAGAVKTRIFSLFKGGSSSGISLFDLRNLASAVYLVQKIGNALSSMMELPDLGTAMQYRLKTYDESGMTSKQIDNYTYDIARESRSGYQATGDLAARVLITGATGYSAKESLDLAGILNKASFLGGASSQSSESALLQLTQALASGELAGDELRSIREQASGLTDTLSKGLARLAEKGELPELFKDTTVGRLKALGAEGELTSERVIRAFKAMEDDVNEAFKAAPKQFGQATAQMRNIWTRFLMGMNEEGEALNIVNDMMWNLVDALNSDAGMKFLRTVQLIARTMAEGFSKGIDKIKEFVNNVRNADDFSVRLQRTLFGISIILTIIVAKLVLGFLSATWPIIAVVGLVWLLVRVLEAAGIQFEDVINFVIRMYDTVKTYISGAIEKMKEWLDQIIESGQALETFKQILMNVAIVVGIILAVAFLNWAISSWKVILAVTVLIAILGVFNSKVEESGETAEKAFSETAAEAAQTAANIWNVVVTVIQWILNIVTTLLYAVAMVIAAIVYLFMDFKFSAEMAINSVSFAWQSLLLGMQQLKAGFIGLFNTIGSALVAAFNIAHNKVLDILISLLGKFQNVAIALDVVTKGRHNFEGGVTGAMSKLEGAKRDEQDLVDVVTAGIAGTASEIDAIGAKYQDNLAEFSAKQQELMEGRAGLEEKIFGTVHDKFASWFDNLNSFADKMKLDSDQVYDKVLNAMQKLEKTDSDKDKDKAFDFDEWLKGFNNKLDEYLGGAKGGGEVLPTDLDNLLGKLPGSDKNPSNSKVNGGKLDEVGKIKGDVNISDEDLKLLRDIAARDFLVNVKTVTPTATFTFGDIKETADINKILKVLQDMVDEQLATSVAVT